MSTEWGRPPLPLKGPEKHSYLLDRVGLGLDATISWFPVPISKVTCRQRRQYFLDLLDVLDVLFLSFPSVVPWLPSFRASSGPDLFTKHRVAKKLSYDGSWLVISD